MARCHWPILLVLLLVMPAATGCRRGAAQNPEPGHKQRQAPSTAGEYVAFTEQELGVAVYPGAAQTEGMKQEEGNTYSIAARFTTPDEYLRVQAFYKERYPNAMPTETGSSLTLSLMDEKYTTVRIIDGNPVAIIIEQQVQN